MEAFIMADKVKILTNQKVNSVTVSNDNEIVISVMDSEMTVGQEENGVVYFFPSTRRVNFKDLGENLVTGIENWSKALKEYSFEDIISGALCLTSDGYPFRVRYVMKDDVNSEEITGRFLVQFKDGSFKEFTNTDVEENAVRYHNDNDITFAEGVDFYLGCFEHPFVVKGIDGDIVTLSNIDLDGFVDINKSYLKDERLTEDIIQRGIMYGALIPHYKYEEGAKYKYSERLKKYLQLCKDSKESEVKLHINEDNFYGGETGVTKDGFSYKVISTTTSGNVTKDLTVRFNLDKSTMKLSLEEYKAGFNYKDRLKNIKVGDYITIPYFKDKCRITKITEKSIYFFSKETNEVHRVGVSQLETGVIPDKLYKMMTKDRS